MAIVVLDCDEFREMQPRFSEMSDAQIQGAFASACLLLDNTEKSTVPYDPENGVETRKTLLYLLTCHILSMSQLPNGVAGPLTSASEGSVSTGWGTMSSTSGAWYNQTPCGQAFWAAIKRWLIGGRYYPSREWHPWG